MSQPNQAELLQRLELVERMVAEGRRSTERWGWVFLLWGIGPLTAMFWVAALPYKAWAWPVVMALCLVVNGLVLRRRKPKGRVQTTLTRSVGAVWACTGATVLLIGFGAAFSQSPDPRLLYVAWFALAAVAHGASSVMLRWPAQLVIALVWWTACAAAFIVPEVRLQAIAATALLLGNVGLGAWLTYCERSRRDG